MSPKTLISLVAGGLLLIGSLVFYFWNEKVRPQAELAQRQQQELTRACQVHQAARDGNLVLLQQMFEAGCSVNGHDDFGLTPLHVAANDRVAEYLISKGAFVDATDGRGYTPLRVMQMTGRNSVADLLKRHGAKQ